MNIQEAFPFSNRPSHLLYPASQLSPNNLIGLRDYYSDVEGMCVALDGLDHDFRFLSLAGKFACQDMSLPVMDAAAVLKVQTKGKWAWGRLGNTSLEGDQCVI